MFIIFQSRANSDEEKKMNASYIISIARKLGCSIFLLPEDITEVICRIKTNYEFDYIYSAIARLSFHFSFSCKCCSSTIDLCDGVTYITWCPGESKNDPYVDCKHHVLVLEATC